MTFDQEPTARYDADGEARRVARVVSVLDAIPTRYDADNKFGTDHVDRSSLTELVDAAHERLKHIADEVSQRSVIAPPHQKGDSA